MKSIIEQASSIIKAIEKAWNQAEQPKEFSIKVFEKEERNFFGMSTKPAKIGIFFGDKPIIHEKPVQKARPDIRECRPATPAAKAPVTPIAADKSAIHKSVQKNPLQAQQVRPTRTPMPQQKPIQQAPKAMSEKSHGTSIPKETSHRVIPAAAVWSEAMIIAAHSWLKKTLDLMDMESITFNSEVAGKNLKLTFNVPLIEDIIREKQLFRSFAHLIISSLRNQYKQEIKDLKVILIRPTQS